MEEKADNNMLAEDEKALVKSGNEDRARIKHKNRVIRTIGWFLLLLLFALVVTAVLTYLADTGDPLLDSMVYIACSGGIGGLLYSMRGFYKFLIIGKFDTRYRWWYIYRPFMSMVAGVYSFFLIKGGLFAVGVSGDISLTRSVMFYCSIAFLAGFSFSKFADKIYEISKVAFGKTEKRKQKVN